MDLTSVSQDHSFYRYSGYNAVAQKSTNFLLYSRINFRNVRNPDLSLGGGHGDLRYCGIKLFFKRYFGNLDFNVRYCGII